MIRYPRDMTGCGTHVPDANWPWQRHWNMEAIHEFSARAGFWRLHRLLKDYHITVYGVATARTCIGSGAAKIWKNSGLTPL